MRFSGRAALSLIVIGLLALSAAVSLSQSAPAPQSGAPALSSQFHTVHTIADLDGPWRFQIGDNPQWADPAFDDSAWPTVTPGKPLSELGFETYAGAAWYRLRVDLRQIQQVSPGQPVELLLTPETVGQLSIFVNGTEIAHTRGISDRPQMYESLPLEVSLPAGTSGGPMLIAIRTWAAPGLQISHGLLERVQAGSPQDISDSLAIATSRRWDQRVIAGMILSFLFLCVAALGAILYLAQRHHSEYLWLALLCVSVSLTAAVDNLWHLQMIPYSIYIPLNLWTSRLFMAVTLEFILRFTGEPKRRFVRFVQVFVLLLPFIFIFGLDQIFQPLSVTAEVLFCGLVTWLLFAAWRRGFREAGVMLVPFFLAAIASSIDTVLGYLADRHWIAEGFASHRFHIGPIEFGTGDLTYAVFLASLIAVILYRFVRVSQEEQRSNAEIAAARSVQAMLIPTELPSNRYFILESAYVPVNGVGGDFFQVVPVKDGSLLIVAGDVSGKGLQAAMNASTIVGAFRNELSHDPATILQHLNNVLIGAESGSQAARNKDKDAVASFATCLCARIYRDGTMEIANAGHLSPYRDGREMELPPGLPLGVIPGMTYEQVSFKLEQGVRIIFLSDGVVEAQNSEGELFGFDRTQQVSNESARYIAQTAKRFGQNDDITVISVYIAACDRRSVPEELVQAY
jgi:hypothetical protein